MHYITRCLAVLFPETMFGRINGTWPELLAAFPRLITPARVLITMIISVLLAPLTVAKFAKRASSPQHMITAFPRLNGMILRLPEKLSALAVFSPKVTCVRNSVLLLLRDPFTLGGQVVVAVKPALDQARSDISVPCRTLSINDAVPMRTVRESV